MKAPGSKGQAETVPTIKRSEYLAALDVANAASMTAKFEDEARSEIFERLKLDVDGKAIAAINQLRGLHAPHVILKEVIDSVSYALDANKIAPWTNEQAKNARERAREVAQVIEHIPQGFWPLPHRSTQNFLTLQVLYEYWESIADGYEASLAMQFLPKKINVPNVQAMVALRMIRDGLSQKGRAQHQPLQRLVEVAMNMDISDSTVREALRHNNSIQARAKPLDPAQPPTSVDRAEKKHVKSPQRKKSR